ncbi:hypothetical protein ABW19_dt0203058 [Dactylella cylindrospora]|nr:hypothetical protein ABW19_dt0203058 [Dactylella cylindrospora]
MMAATTGRMDISLLGGQRAQPQRSNTAGVQFLGSQQFQKYIAGFCYTPEYLHVEGNVNGIWNTILHVIFSPFNTDFVVNPEYYIGSSRTDLFVGYIYMNPDNHNLPPWQVIPRLIYEGKGQKGDSWLLIEKQLQDYWKRVKFEPGVEGSGWAVGARGDEVKFWKYTEKRSNLIPIYVEGLGTTARTKGELKVVAKDTTQTPFYLWKMEHWKAIVKILEAMMYRAKP